MYNKELFVDRVAIGAYFLTATVKISLAVYFRVQRVQRATEA